MKTFLDFLAMGGYGKYVWSAYLFAAIFLSVQWVYPWRRWRHLLQQHQKTEPQKIQVILPATPQPFEAIVVKKAVNDESYS